MGQTLEEENNELDQNMWHKSYDEKEIKNYDIKLFGGLQFERMMNLFKYVVFQISSKINEEISIQEIQEAETLLGTNISNFSHQIWVV